MTRKAGSMLLLMVVAAHGFLKSYEVMPVKASWSSWTQRAEPASYVAQTITANFDSVAYCELFVGDVGNVANHYEDIGDANLFRAGLAALLGTRAGGQVMAGAAILRRERLRMTRGEVV